MYAQSSSGGGGKSFKVGPFRGLPRFYYPHVPVCRRDILCTNQMCAYIHPEREASKMKWVYNYTQPINGSRTSRKSSKGLLRKRASNKTKETKPTPPLTKSAFPALPSAPVPSTNTSKTTASRSMWGNGSLYNMEPQQNKFSQPSFGTPDWSFAAQAAAERNSSFNTAAINTRDSPAGSSPLREGNWPESLNHVLAGVSSLVDDMPISPSSLAVSYSPVATPDNATESLAGKEVETLELSPPEKSEIPKVEVEKHMVAEKSKAPSPKTSRVSPPTSVTNPPSVSPVASPLLHAEALSSRNAASANEDRAKKEVAIASDVTTPTPKVAPKEVFAKPLVMEEPADLETYRRFSLRGGKAQTEIVAPSTSTNSDSSKTNKKSKNVGRNRKKQKKQTAPAVVSLDEAHKTETQHLDIPLPSRNSTYQPTPIPQLAWNSIVAFFCALGAFLVHIGVGLKDVMASIAGALVAAFSAFQDSLTRQSTSTLNNAQRSRRSRR